MILRTKEDWQTHLFVLAMEAYDAAFGYAVTEHEKKLRVRFAHHARERMAQAAQVIALRFPPKG